MTDESRGIEAAGPPWSVDLLADLHAGVLDDDEAARLWPLVQADPEARAIIDALEATAADLADLSADVPPMPAEFAARLDAAIAEESRRAFPQQQQPGVAPVVSLDAARHRRKKRIGWISGVVAVAAAAVAAVAIAIPGGTSPSSGGNVAAPPPGQSAPQPPLNLRSDQAASAVGQMQGTFDYGPLGGADALQTCLTAAGFADTAKPIGVRQGSIDGQPAVLTLLTTGQLAKFRLVAFAPTCGAGNAGVLLDKVIG
ncbi:anti-sigma factor family protein [Amycolatopsis methanolica]|uniref:anti-sigma factor family protein n=1 Tax=Amycolatopsis methanolica TaxID=1814 RepID=UPI003449DDD3